MISEELQEELKRLKRENKALREENRALLEELEQSQAIYKQSLNAITSLRKPFNQPPNEILIAIFERVILPTFLVDCSASLVPNSLWHQIMLQKCSLVSVCSSWYNVGIPFLYEDISIGHLLQLTNLLKCLENSPLNHQDLIKTINIHCFIPDFASHYFQHNLARLLAICPKLTGFSYTSGCQLPRSSSLPLLPSTITHLCVNGLISYSVFESLLQATSDSLMSLSFAIPMSDTPPESSLRNISLPRLRDMTCQVSSGNMEGFDTLHSRWDMPKLRHWSFRPSTLDLLNNALRNPITAFCTKYGPRLQSLAIYPNYFKMVNLSHHDLFGMQHLLDLCPALEHVVVHPMTLPRLHHQNVKWIDIWESHTSPICVTNLEELRSNVTHQAFPSLKGIRILSASLSHIINLHLYLPPQLVRTSTDSFSFRFLQFEVRHGVGVIHQPSRPWCNNLYGANLDDNTIAHLETTSTDSDSTYEDPSDEDSNSEDSDSLDYESDSNEISPGWGAEMDLFSP